MKKLSWDIYWKNMKKNESGFSLVEVMVAVGLMGGLAYFLMVQQDTSGKIQSKMNFNLDLNSVSTQIQTLIAKRANCTLTIAGKKLGDTVSEIRTGIDDPINPFTDPPIFKKVIFTQDQIIGTTGLRIEKMTLVEKVDEKGVVIGDALRVHFKAGRDGADGFNPLKAMGVTELSKDFLINGEKEVDGSYKYCYSEEGNMIETATKEACNSIGASWNSETKKCKLTNLPQCMMVEGSECGTLFTQSGAELFLHAKASNRRRCVQTYERDGPGCLLAGPKTFTRECFCYTTNCECSTKKSTCYTREKKVCTDDDLKEVKFKRCCRPL